MNQQVESDKLLKILRRRKLPEFKDLPAVCKFVTKFMVRHYDLYDGSDINRGYCFIWAYLVWALSKHEVKFVTSDGHVVVDDGELFYDSENPNGDCDLKFFDYMGGDDVVNVDVRGMSWYWVRCGVAKKEFRSILRRTCNKLYNSVRYGGFKDNDWRYASDLCVDDIPA